MEGYKVDNGIYDECVNITAEQQGVQIRGHHCMRSVTWAQRNASLLAKTTASVSMPSTYNDTKILDLFNNSISAFDGLTDFGISATSVSFTLRNKEFWDVEFVCSSMLMVLIGFLLLCTLIDVLQERYKADDYTHPVLSTLAKFSLIKSASSILSSNVEDGHFQALHGIRCLSMVWVVLGHEYLIYLVGDSTNNEYRDEIWVHTWKSIIVYAAPFAVDSFFTISGFLMTYLFLKQMQKKKNFNIPLYYFHRYIRLTPAVIALVVFAIVFMPKMGSGPHWDRLLDFGGTPCRQKWWTQILYVQNFVLRDNVCLVHLWYLAVDMQLFWISPLILYPLHKKPKLGLAILFVCFLASIVIPGTINGLNKYPALTFLENGKTKVATKAFMDVYEMPYNRSGAWLVGIWLGYLVTNNNRRLKKFAVVIGWLVTIGAFSFCLFGTRSFLVPNYEYDPIWEAMFVGVSRQIWAIGVCWIVYACLNNHAGPISTILSSKIFLPLSRISYSVYLVHMVIQTMQVSARRTPIFFSDFFIWRDSIADLVLAVVVGFFFCLLFETPVMVLEKMIFKKKRQNDNKLLKISDQNTPSISKQRLLLVGASKAIK